MIDGYLGNEDSACCDDHRAYTKDCRSDCLLARIIAVTSRMSREPGQTGTSLQDRRGRRLPLSCRLFFFGDDDFEGEAKMLDVSTKRVQRRIIDRSKDWDDLEIVSVSR